MMRVLWLYLTESCTRDDWKKKDCDFLLFVASGKGAVRINVGLTPRPLLGRMAISEGESDRVWPTITPRTTLTHCTGR